MICNSRLFYLSLYYGQFCSELKLTNMSTNNNTYKYGFRRRTKNEYEHMWLKTYNDDHSYGWYNKPVEWEADTIFEFFRHIELKTFGGKFTITKFFEDYKLVVWKSEEDFFHLNLVEKLITRNEERYSDLQEELEEVLEEL